MPAQGTGRQVKTRIYMEGRWIPDCFVSCVISGGVGAPATAQIELVPTNTIKHILAFTWIHIFTTDPWDLNPAGDLSDFKLAFEGAVISRGFVRQGEGRNFVIQCASPQVFWAKAEQRWLNVASADGGLVDQLAIQTSGGYGRFGTVSKTGSYGYLASKLAFDRQDAEERFMDTLISVLDDIGNVNPFYTNARNRFRITDRIIRGPAGKTDKLFQVALMGDFLEGLAGRVSGQSNLVDVVNQLLSAIFHEWVAVPAPPYIKTTIFDRDAYGNVKRNAKTVSGRGPRGRDTVNLYDVQTAQDMVVADTIFKPHCYTIAPPNCNVLFPNMYDGMRMSENFLGEPTRLSMQPQLPVVDSSITSGLFLHRPTELEIFRSLTFDPKTKSALQRTPDGQYADGAGQSPAFTDWDWATNEERIRGITNDFINMAPAPSTLTLSDQGRRTPTGAREGGIPKYLQNVASYEWYKSKFVNRTTELSGPYNMRPVPGFPMLALDDSAASLNVISNLEGITHNINANGAATTQYTISHARLVDEVDLNRPRFSGGFNKDGSVNLDLFRDANGNYDWSRLFDGLNQPPIPEWFDPTFRNVIDLDLKYRSWFGPDAGVVQNILFKNPGEKPDEAALKSAQQILGSIAGGTASISSVGDALRAYQGQVDEFEAILQQNENISLQDTVTELNRRYRKARDQGKEFQQSAQATARSFTKIDEAFRFIGAAPREVADLLPSGGSFYTFEKRPATSRQIDYRNMKLDYFVGDTSAGSGYSGAPEGTSTAGTSTTTTTQNAGGVVADAISGADPAPPADRMSGAFPVFDTETHEGKAATDPVTRSALLKNANQRSPSTWPRYDGRPIMFDFELRLWKVSVEQAGYELGGQPDTVSASHVVDANGNVVRPKTATELAADAKQHQIDLAAQKKQQDSQSAMGKTNPKKATSIQASDQAPTGDGLEQNLRLPLPQPLSEKQVVDMRRAIVDAYRDELARTRGFTG